MKSIKTQFNLKFAFLFCIFYLSGGAFAQLGYSSASLSMGKMSSNSRLIPESKKVIIEEYFNYHKHDISTPEKGNSVAIDLNSTMAEDKSMVLQVGLSTGFIDDIEKAPPVNVCLVIDRSGSMQGDRIENAKEAAIEFVSRLRKKDHISVVLFDDRIDVLIPSQPVSNKDKLIDKLRTINSRGSTNLNEGLIRGYDEVFKNYKKGQNNKVIMLTDALTNTGVVDPTEIVKGSNHYKSEHEIDITMVGVGIDFNSDLSREITSSNRSSLFFINDAEDIKKVFIDEIESLLSPVAKNVSLTINVDPSVKINHFFGYSPSIRNNTIELDLENMNSGLTQVFLIKLDPSIKPLKELKLSATLNYFDIEKQKNTTLKQTANLIDRQETIDRDVQKNYCIARLAQCIKDMATLFYAEEYEKADYQVDYILNSTESYYPNLEDQDIKRVYDILARYQKVLKEQIPDQTAKLNFPY